MHSCFNRAPGAADVRCMRGVCQVSVKCKQELLSSARAKNAVLRHIESSKRCVCGVVVFCAAVPSNPAKATCAHSLTTPSLRRERMSSCLPASCAVAGSGRSLTACQWFRSPSLSSVVHHPPPMTHIQHKPFPPSPHHHHIPRGILPPWAFQMHAAPHTSVLGQPQLGHSTRLRGAGPELFRHR